MTNDNITLDISYAPQTLEAVEYTRIDAFIEKAIEWISNNCYIPHATLEDFRNYMEGE